MPRKRSFFSRLFSRSVQDSKEVSESCSAGHASEGRDVLPIESAVEVWLHPDTEELKRQTLMKARKIEKPVFLIGRRTSESIAYPEDNPPDLILFESSPYTLSKLQCQIVINDDEVILRDLGSRSGTILGKKKLLSRKRKPTSVVVPKGSHSLILGHHSGPFHFRLVVS